MGSLDGPRHRGQQAMQLVEQQDNYIKSREETMHNIESTIVELSGIFQQLAHMVKEQEEQVQRSAANPFIHYANWCYLDKVTSNKNFWFCMLLQKLFGSCPVPVGQQRCILHLAQAPGNCLCNIIRWCLAETVTCLHKKMSEMASSFSSNGSTHPDLEQSSLNNFNNSVLKISAHLWRWISLMNVRYQLHGFYFHTLSLTFSIKVMTVCNYSIHWKFWNDTKQQYWTTGISWRYIVPCSVEFHTF